MHRKSRRNDEIITFAASTSPVESVLRQRGTGPFIGNCSLIKRRQQEGKNKFTFTSPLLKTGTLGPERGEVRRLKRSGKLCSVASATCHLFVKTRSRLFLFRRIAANGATRSFLSRLFGFFCLFFLNSSWNSGSNIVIYIFVTEYFFNPPREIKISKY